MGIRELKKFQITLIFLHFINIVFIFIIDFKENIIDKRLDDIIFIAVF